MGVTCIIEPFPSSRSLGGRLFQNTAFARKIQQRVQELGLKPALVQANDHWEGLLGRVLAKVCQIKSSMLLRSPGMTRDNYIKYDCAQYDFLAAVGDELRERAKSWDPGREIKLIYDGLYTSEFSPPKSKVAVFPKKILVIGSPLDWKGWADLTEALFLLQSKMDFFGYQFDFTGAKPDPALNDLKLERISSIKTNFLGRVENFKELVLGYDLAINPSREESFGMAALEVLAFGVPLLSSRTGVIEKVQTSSAMLFRPNNPAGLANSLSNLMAKWSLIEPNVTDCQKNIMKHFNMEDSAHQVFEAYQKLMG